MRFPTAIVIGLLFASLVAGQGRRQSARGVARPGKSPTPSDVMQMAVAHFEGTLRNLDKKTLRLDLDDGQSLVFRRSKTTAFVPAGNRSRIEIGTKVQVEAHKDKVGDLEAVRVCEGTCPTVKDSR